MKFFLQVALVLGLLCTKLGAQNLAAIPPLVGRVVDTASVLSTSGRAELEGIINSLEAEKGSQIAVLVVDSTIPESIDQYSFRVAEEWKVGRKKINDGVLVVIAIKDRKSRIEVGYGLEGAIPDITAKRILDDQVRPYFKNGDFDAGLRVCIESLAKLIRGEELPAPSSNFGNEVSDDAIFNIIMFGLISSLILKLFLEKLHASFLAAALAATAGFVLYVPVVGVFGGLVTLFLSMFSSSSGSGGYSSGSRSSGWSSSSSSSGGGGGSFGGGGASGSW